MNSQEKVLNSEIFCSVAAHHSFFHILDIVASLLLLSLAIIERPAVDSIKVPIVVRIILLINYFCMSLIYDSMLTLVFHLAASAHCWMNRL